MLIIHVRVRVKPEFAEEFKRATSENASQSLNEPGVARFDVLQEQDDPTRFLLSEAYLTADAPAAHKETRHYQRWRDTVEPMMAEPRHSTRYASVFPETEGQ
jgi:(4S)-4-hydroxy-5-phosphonooxypentane-2,3-dione isomerase